MAGGASVVAAQGRYHRGTTGAGRGATGGSKPGGISGAGHAGCQSRGTYSGEVGPNGGNHGVGLTKKIQVS
jgi:hypothetical protein